MVYWQTKCSIVQHSIPKGALLTQPVMRKYRLPLDNVTFFRKICMNSKQTYYKGKFRFPKENAEIIELPRMIDFK